MELWDRSKDNVEYNKTVGRKGYRKKRKDGKVDVK